MTRDRWKTCLKSDKSWEPGTLSHSHTLSLFHSLIHSLSTCWTTFVFMSMLKSHSISFSLSHSITLDMQNNFCFHVYVQKSLSQFPTHSLSLSHSLTLSLSHSFTLSFTLSRHAEQLLFSCLCSKVAVYCRKLQCFFFGPPQHPIRWL